METICGVIAIEMLLMAVVSSGEIVTHPHNCLQRNDTLVLHIFLYCSHPYSSSELNNNVIRIFNTFTITE